MRGTDRRSEGEGEGGREGCIYLYLKGSSLLIYACNSNRRYVRDS